MVFGFDIIPLCIICSIILLFVKIYKLSSKVDSLTQDVSELLRERHSERARREFGHSSPSSSEEAGFSESSTRAQGEDLRTLNGAGEGFSHAKPQTASLDGQAKPHPGESAVLPPQAANTSSIPVAPRLVQEKSALEQPSAALFGECSNAAQTVASAASENESSVNFHTESSASLPEGSRKAPPLSKTGKSFEHVQWDLSDSEKTVSFNFPEFFRKYVAANALLWIGALALALSGIFLAKYSIERGLLTPLMRVLGAAFMAAVLFAGGEFVLRKFSRKMIAGLLAGAGITVAYGDLCAAAQLYSMMPLWVALFGMVVLSVLAYSFTARYGIGMFYLAIMGMFLAPALTSGDNPSTLLLVCYLSIATVASAYAAVQRNCVPALLFIIADNICWIIFWHICALINFSTGFDINNYLYIFAYMLFYSWVFIFAFARIKFSNFYKKVPEFFAKTVCDGRYCAVLLKGFLRDGALAFSAFIFLLDFLTFLTLPDAVIAFFLIFAYLLLWRMRGCGSAIFTGIFCVMGTYRGFCYMESDFMLICFLYAVFIPIAIGIFFSQSNRAIKLGAILAALIFICTILGLFKFGSESAYKFALAAVLVASVVSGYIGLLKRARQHAYLRGAYLFLGVLSIIAFFSFFEIRRNYSFEFSVSSYFAIAAGSIAAFMKTKDWILRNAAMAMQAFLVFLLLILVNVSDIMVVYNDWNSRVALKFILMSAISFALFAYFAKNSKGYSNVFEFFGMLSSICLVAGFAFYMSVLIYSGSKGPLPLEVRMLAFSLSSLVSIPILILSRRASFTGMGTGAYIAAFAGMLFVFYLFADIFSARISGWFIANTLTVAMFALGAACFVLARLTEKGKLQMLLSAAALFIAFIWANSQVRFYFHPNILGGAMGDVEFYSYSVLWMLLGLTSLVCGRLWKSVNLEYASLVFVLGAVFKVFFFDAAELDGLLRVASFGLLGIILFGIGGFYTRFVFRRN